MTARGAIESAGAFVSGAFVEFCRLLLVFAAAAFGAGLVASGGAASIGALLPGFLFFAFYALFLLHPARDLVQGWLGMLAARQPRRFENRAENVGRATAAIALAVGFLPLVLATKRTVHEAQAFEFAFTLLAIVVFGVGGAVPRVWFAFHGVAPGAPDEVPDLLREAGKRAALFFYCAVVGMGAGLVGAEAAKDRRPPDAEPEARLWQQFEGRLCVSESESCPRTSRVEIRVPRAGDVAIEIGPDPRLTTPPVCHVAPDKTWPRADAARADVEARLNGDDGRATAPAIAGDRIVLGLTIPEDATECTYFLDVEQPDAGP